MRYITQNHPRAIGQWVLAEDGFIAERCRDRDHALARLNETDSARWESLTAAGVEDTIPWTADPAIAFVGVPTSDKRQLEPGGEQFRQFPMPLMAQVQTAWGHDGAIIAGRIDQAEVSGDKLTASGAIDGGAFGRDIARLIDNGMLTGISVDLGAIEVETDFLEVDEDGWPTDWLDRFTKWELMGATITPFPAFADARVKLDGDAPTGPQETVDAVVASGGPAQPPAEWFDNPLLDEPTPLTITDDGRVFGHIATWNTCHIGRQGGCVTPPRSGDYSYFTTGVIRCEEGCEIPVGVISVGGGHADIGADANAAARHYDATSSVGAYVAAGEDDHGIWVAGAVRPGITDEELAELRGSAPSGDWRRLDGKLKLVAVLGVNVPGFPVPRSRVASGEPEALVAAIAPRQSAAPAAATHETKWVRHEEQELERRLARLEQIVLPQEADRLAARVHNR